MSKYIVQQLLHAGLDCDFRVSVIYLRVLQYVESEEVSMTSLQT